MTTLDVSSPSIIHKSFSPFIQSLTVLIMNKMNMLKFHFSIPCSLIDMATRMIKGNQEKAVSFFLVSFLLHKLICYILMISFSAILLRAIVIYCNTTGSHRPYCHTCGLASSPPSWSPLFLSILSAQFIRPSQVKNPEDSLFCKSKSNLCSVLHHTLHALAPWNLSDLNSQDSSVNLAFSRAL